MLIAFTAQQTQQLTGLTARRLAYWDETDVYYPTFRDDRRSHGAYRKMYSFRDLVGLRTLATLRDEFNVSLEELRRTGQHLMQFTDDPWSNRFWVHQGRVLFHLPDSSNDGLIDRRGQLSYIDLGAIWTQVEQETARWSERDRADIGHISRHRHIQHNQWVVKGTRVTTSAVWSFHQAGYDTAGIIREYPTLETKDVEAAIAHECARQWKAA